MSSVKNCIYILNIKSYEYVGCELFYVDKHFKGGG